MKSKLFFKKISLLEFFLIVLGGALAAIGGYLISNQNWYFGIISFLSFFIVNFILHCIKQNVHVYGPISSIPPLASNYPQGTILTQYKE